MSKLQPKRTARHLPRQRQHSEQRTMPSDCRFRSWRQCGTNPTYVSFRYSSLGFVLVCAVDAPAHLPFTGQSTLGSLASREKRIGYCRSDACIRLLLTACLAHDFHNRTETTSASTSARCHDVRSVNSLICSRRRQMQRCSERGGTSQPGRRAHGPNDRMHHVPTLSRRCVSGRHSLQLHQLSLSY